jgi:hypothetical protein
MTCENSVRPTFTAAVPDQEKSEKPPQNHRSKFKSTPSKIDANTLPREANFRYVARSTGQQ